LEGGRTANAPSRLHREGRKAGREKATGVNVKERPHPKRVKARIKGCTGLKGGVPRPGW